MFRFGDRSAGNFQVANGLRSRALTAAFGNGCGNGERGTAELSRYNALLGIRDGRAQKIHVPSEYSGATPDREFTKVVHALRWRIHTPTTSPIQRTLKPIAAQWYSYWVDYSVRSTTRLAFSTQEFMPPR